MKSDFFNISELSQVIRNRAEPEYARAFADLYWRGLLALAILAIAGACAFGILQFFDALSAVSSTASNNQATIPATKTIDRVKMQEILDDFSGRISGVQSLSALPLPALGDPSK